MAADAVLVEVTTVRGSAPREAGAWMLVRAETVAGTIGGGALEHAAIAAARAMLAEGAAERRIETALGPDTGQCCGGRVALRLSAADAAAQAAARAAHEAAAHPTALLFGAGHVNRALAAALAPLPIAATLIDQRPEELARAAPSPRKLSALPEAEIDAAPPGALIVVATHDHGLDFVIAAHALRRAHDRRDLAYVGLIGSATKRARFAAFARRQDLDPSPLVCPIGAAGAGDKRPAVIAAHVAAELLRAAAATRDATGAATGTESLFAGAAVARSRRR